MERKQYLDQIKELVQTVQTLLDANIALGNKQKELQASFAIIFFTSFANSPFIFSGSFARPEINICEYWLENS